MYIYIYKQTYTYTHILSHRHKQPNFCIHTYTYTPVNTYVHMHNTNSATKRCSPSLPNLNTYIHTYTQAKTAKTLLTLAPKQLVITTDIMTEVLKQACKGHEDLAHMTIMHGIIHTDLHDQGDNNLDLVSGVQKHESNSGHGIGGQGQGVQERDDHASTTHSDDDILNFAQALSQSISCISTQTLGNILHTLKNHANSDALRSRDSRGRNIAHLACKWRLSEVLFTLHELGVDDLMDSRDNKGKTPAHFSKKCVECIQYIDHLGFSHTLGVYDKFGNVPMVRMEHEMFQARAYVLVTSCDSQDMDLNSGT
jgi:hypothetical protein